MKPIVGIYSEKDDKLWEDWVCPNPKDYHGGVGNADYHFDSKAYNSRPSYNIQKGHGWKDGGRYVGGVDFEFMEARTWTEHKEYGFGCAECCNGDRCDDDCDAEYRRPNCPYCKGKGWFKEKPLICIPIAKEAKEDWKVGDEFTTPETGDKKFTVRSVREHEVSAVDYRSASGYTIFSKNYITKVKSTPPKEAKPAEGRTDDTHYYLGDFQSYADRILRDKGASNRDVFDAINDTVDWLSKTYRITRIDIQNDDKKQNL